MLPFEDPRWNELSTFYDDDLASVVHEWSMAVGFDQESDIYHRLFNLYLHQNTITNSAFVVVPYVVKHCQSVSAEDRAGYLIDVATVEYCRLRHGCWDGSPELDWAMQSYNDSIEIAQELVESVLDEGIDPELAAELRTLQPVLYGNLEMAIERQASRDNAG
ncbi:hypothetical protein KOR42_55350 [Thalassoglobus neptunius]|uniref:Uncharacterized protein n=2 Tax=Thalassoglobus neptunius TaxID=1938619 RepID=A0A5C5UT45_9PLAN|nr:hypothetical protein KOR42_55350 [Thalassoglobus neptunius]